ncbi:SDR family oxidoreductase [Microvirga sp. TS319]|uniref:SDR family oxidoreductase n=1 Tax=Microvirga sp. TS319 TaxID=3241165 RepID=UPI00351A4808
MQERTWKCNRVPARAGYLSKRCHKPQEAMQMHVLVLGGYGLIGHPVVSRLLESGHQVTGLGRSVSLARRICPGADWVERDIASLTHLQDWLPILSGIQIVVNCSGALQDSPRDNLQALQADAVKALFEACRIAGCARVVQVSAVGVSRDADTAFLRTKAEADEALMTSDLEWFVLRPGLVIARAAYGGTALIRALASFPFILPMLQEREPIQTVGVDDVADAVLACVEGHVEARTAYDLVETQVHSLKEIVLAFRSWLGFPPVRTVPVPRVIGQAIFKIGDAVSFLGWRPPVRTTVLRQLATGVRGNPEAWLRASGRLPSSLSTILSHMPANAQERWFARLWLLKPPIVVTLSMFWLASGIVGLIEMERAAAILTQRGLGAELARAAVLGGGMVDIVLGTLLLVRSLHKTAAFGMIMVTLAYLVAGTALTPDLWLDPLGAFVKTPPGAVLALVALAIADER